MTTLSLGLHYGIADDTYHADPAPVPSLSSTLARLILDRSPLHAWWAHPRLNPDFEPKDSKTFDIGRAAHRAVLGAGSDYVAIPGELLSDDGGVRRKEAKEWVADARASGLTPLKAAEVDQIDSIADSVRRKLDGMRIQIDPDYSEVTALAEIDGCPVRARFDNAPKGKPYLLDLKTTADASPDGCIRAVAEYGLDLQAAFYLDTWHAATGERRKMRFVFVEKAPPYEVGVIELHARPGDEADWMDDAYGKAACARALWLDGITNNRWPGYPAQVAIIGAPGWYRKKWEDLGAAPQVSDPSPETIARATAWQSPEGYHA
ncbi:MAG TPA: hypothetical protein DEB47_17590 [Citreicella sp.]|nr:hypothetical protein [Citreicella sp.]